MGWGKQDPLCGAPSPGAHNPCYWGMALPLGIKRSARVHARGLSHLAR
jgi:hypothetical protein